MSIDPLVLSADLYSEEAVRETAEAFEGLATIAVAVEGGDIEVTFADAREDVVDRLVDEFANHALAGTVARLGGAR